MAKNVINRSFRHENRAKSPRFHPAHKLCANTMVAAIQFQYHLSFLLFLSKSSYCLVPTAGPPKVEASHCPKLTAMQKPISSIERKGGLFPISTTSPFLINFLMIFFQQKKNINKFLLCCPVSADGNHNFTWSGY